MVLFVCSYVNVYGEVVGVSALEVGPNECAQRIAFVLAFFLDHVRTSKYVAVEFPVLSFLDLEFAGRSGCEVVGDDDVVEQVPCVLISQCSVTGFQYVNERVVHVAFFKILDFGLCTEYLDDALVGGVVVEVAHDYYLCGRIGLAYRVGYVASLCSSGFTFR